MNEASRQSWIDEALVAMKGTRGRFQSRGGEGKVDDILVGDWVLSCCSDVVRTGVDLSEACYSQV